jgi:hypothetical protein
MTLWQIANVQPQIQHDGQLLKLWIMRTKQGRKRTWKATKSAAVKSAQDHGLDVLSIRRGTDKDMSI